MRAIEWGVRPIFVSQPIAPVAMVFFDWWRVVICVFLLAILWVLFVQRAIVVPALGFWGALIVKLKWIACPVCACVLWVRGARVAAIIALLWPILIFVIQFPVMSIGRIRVGDTEQLFLRAIGYEPKQRTQ